MEQNFDIMDLDTTQTRPKPKTSPNITNKCQQVKLEILNVLLEKGIICTVFQCRTVIARYNEHFVCTIFLSLGTT